MTADDCSHFDQIRIQNRRMARNLMRHFPQLSKAALADISGLSFPTVAALLNDLLQTGEVMILPDSPSRGGRPAEQFALNPLFQTAACAYIEKHELFVRVNDVLGNMLIDEKKALTAGRCDEQLKNELMDVQKRYPSLSVVCMGIPGVITDGQITYLPDYPEIQGLRLQDYLEKALSVPVLLENDVNVFVFAEREKWPDLVHIFYGTNCPGAGVLLNGAIVRGSAGYAGELEYLPFDHNGRFVTFAEKLSLIAQDFQGPAKAQMRRTELLSCIARAVTSLVCVINPPDVALSGFGLTDEDTGDLRLELEKIIPAARCPDFHIVDKIDDLYQAGLLQTAMDYWKSK